MAFNREVYILIYIVCFVITMILFLTAEKKKNRYGVFLEWIAFFLLCLLAGIREYGVGTDTTIYFREIIDTAIGAGSFREYMAHEWILFDWADHIVSEYEFGFTLFIYLISRLFQSVAVTQFAVQLLILMPVYIALKRKKEVPLWFGMLVYELLFFNSSLNLVRQYIAMSFSLLAVQLWIDRQKTGSIFVLFIACCFHKTAILTLMILALHEYIQIEWKPHLCLGKIGLYPETVKVFAVVFVGVLLLLLLDPIAKFLRLTPLNGFVCYITGNLRFMPNQMIKLLPPLLVMLCNLNKMDIDRKEAVFYLLMMIITVILLQLLSITEQSSRVADYFLIFSVFSFPLTAKNGKIPRAAMLTYLIFYWLFYYGFHNVGETMPYRVIGQ